MYPKCFTRETASRIPSPNVVYRVGVTFLFERYLQILIIHFPDYREKQTLVSLNLNVANRVGDPSFFSEQQPTITISLKRDISVGFFQKKIFGSKQVQLASRPSHKLHLMIRNGGTQLRAPVPNI